VTTEHLARAFALTRGILANIRPDQLDCSTPCASWDVRAVCNHVIGNTFYFVACLDKGGFSPPPEDDFTAGDMVATYDDGIAEALAAFGAPGALDQTLAMHFGEIPASVFIEIATTDALLHGWDLACATGQSTDLDPELARRQLDISREIIFERARGADTAAPFGPEQPAPPNASPIEALAAFLGRRV
jgi:uncharacterized protein (TIGR03086 family)